MKNNINIQLILLTILVSFSLLASSCSDDDKDDTYMVHFETNGGSAVESITLKSGSIVLRPEDPIKEGRILDAWCLDEDLEKDYLFNTIYYTTQDLRLYARWTQMHTITFETNGGAAIDAVKVKTGRTITRPTTINPSNPDLYLAGWYTDPELTNLFDFSTTITSDYTLYAKWQISVMQIVKFDVNGGTPVDDQRLPLEEFVVRHTISKANNTLVGWYLDANFTTPYDFQNTPVSSDLTLYARWEVSNSLSDFSFDSAKGMITSYKGNASKVVIPESIGGIPVKKLGKALFIDRQDVKTIYLPSSIDELEGVSENTFEDVSRTFHNCGVQDLNLFNTQLKSLPKWTFMYCSIKSLILPGTLIELQQGAFEGSAITAITFPNSVKTIGQYSFFRCVSLEKVKIGQGIEQIRDGVFAESSNLREVVIYKEQAPIPSLGQNDNPFRHTSTSLVIKVSPNLLDEYKNSWTSLSSKISNL